LRPTRFLATEVTEVTEIERESSVAEKKDE